MNVGLILAAGRGTRFGGDRPKQFQVLNDVPVLQYSIRVFERSESVSSYGIVTTEDEQSTVREILDRVGAQDADFVRTGGERRRDSVRLGLRELEPLEPETVMIHDAARPGLSVKLLDRLIEAWGEADSLAGVIPTLPVRNTIKRIDPDTGRVEETLDRDRLRAVQTPQLFDFKRLLEVHRNWDPEESVTDDASMLEARGETIGTVRGLERNAKITRPGDLDVISRCMEGDNGE
jgi:2-C-methyl-D-erythritol 4-phosphate cytidylyltransferase